MIYRHPAALANMAATVDIISGGAIELASGPGGTRWSATPTGSISAAAEGAVRSARRGGVEAIVGLLSQTTTMFAGQYVSLPRPGASRSRWQQMHLLDMIGGRGKTRTLRDRARWA